MAFDEPQCSRLEREAAILRTIRTGDPHGEHSQHIVTWLYPDHFLTHESDNLYLTDEAGDLSPSSASPAAAAVSPMKSLVLESGGVNLKQLLLSNGSRFTVPVAQRVHILQDIVGALHFLHGLNIVHFDVKPENIVCFPSASGSGSRWKLIDLDSSYDVNLPPSSPGGLPVISCCSSANDEVLVTKEYLSPEVMRVLNYRSPGRGDPHPSAAPGPAPPADVEVSWRLDIWSLGLVAVFLFSDHSLWEALHPTRPFQHSMVSGVTQPQIQLLLTRSFGHKEKSFLEACLQVESRERKPASELLAKSLFKTDNSTTLRLSSDSMSQRFADLEGLLSRYREESQSLVCDELEDKFSDFSLFLSNQLERVHHLSPEEKQTVVGEQGGR
jgi:serine/threonine protein kinase